MHPAKKHWNAEAKQYWRKMQAVYQIEERDLPALGEACECLTQLEAANAALVKYGAVIKSGNIVKKNPWLDLAKVARSGLMQALRILKVEDDPKPRPGRPASGSKHRIIANFEEDDNET